MPQAYFASGVGDAERILALLSIQSRMKGKTLHTFSFALVLSFLSPLYLLSPLISAHHLSRPSVPKAVGSTISIQKHRLELLSPDYISSNPSIVYCVVDLRPISSRVSSGSRSRLFPMLQQTILPLLRSPSLRLGVSLVQDQA